MKLGENNDINGPPVSVEIIPPSTEELSHEPTLGEPEHPIRHVAVCDESVSMSEEVEVGDDSSCDSSYLELQLSESTKVSITNYVLLIIV